MKYVVTARTRYLVEADSLAEALATVIPEDQAGQMFTFGDGVTLDWIYAHDAEAELSRED
jgi:hypothetical protein